MNKTVLITGGNRGIGLAAVKAMAALEYKVLLGCRILEEGKAVADSIDGDVVPVQMELANRDILMKQVDKIKREHPVVDVLINNAGILLEGTIHEITPEKFYESMQVNILSVFDLIQAFLPGMMNRGYGRIVNVSSDWGSFDQGLMGPVAYSTSKAAVNGLTLSMSRSLSGDVKVNTMSPGWVRTKMGGDSAPRTPEKGAETIVWLATLPSNGPNGGFFMDKKEIKW